MVEVPIKLYVQGLAKKAKEAVRPLARSSGAIRSRALENMRELLLEEKESILEANQQDLDVVSKDLDAQAYRQALDQVRITKDAFDEMVDGLNVIIEQPDPIGEIPRLWSTADGLQVSRMRVPIGVIAVVSDMGPQVLLNAVSMCLKTGNVCVYRGGTEWFHTNRALITCLQKAVEQAGLPIEGITFLDRPEPDAALEVVRLTKYVNGVIAKGKASLRKGIMEHARVPLIGYDGGVSHMYIDEGADIPLAQTLAVNAKIQDPAASNALDTLLVHHNVARPLLPGLIRRLLEEFRVDVRGCPKTVSMVGIMEMTDHLGIKEAGEKDWGQKFQSLVLAIKIVADLDDALNHIAQYEPGHTDTIVTRDYDAAMRFVREVDSSAVLINASTRLHSGDQFGLGPEIGMNTNHFHARGPVTLQTLTSEKFVALGTGQLQQPHPIPQAYEDAMMLSPKF